MSAWQPWWRLPIYTGAVLAILIACYWLVGFLIALGLNSGSTLRVVTLFLTAALLPFAASVFLALRAIASARRGRRGGAALSASLALLPVPLAWLILDVRLV